MKHDDHDDFAVLVGARGSITSVEAGRPDAVPDGVLEAAGRLAATGHGDTQARFVWVGDAASERYLVTVDVHGSGPRRTADVSGRQAFQLPFGITVRELDVLSLVAIGATNTEIAGRLFLSTRTVTTHVDRIMRKLGVSHRTSAAVIAAEEGLIRLPFPGGEDGFDALRLGRQLSGRDAAPGPATEVISWPRLTRTPLVVGAALPLRGWAAADGIEMARATQLAVEEINARGGIDGRLLSMEIMDVDIMDVDSVRRTFTELTERDVDVITSGYVPYQDVAHDIVADSGIPYLHAATMAAMERRVLDDPVRHARIFQVCPSDRHYAPRFVEEMTALRDRGEWVPSSDRLAVVMSPWAMDLQASPTDLGVAEAARLAERHGWALELVQPMDHSITTWAGVAERIVHSEPAAVMLGHYLVDGTAAFLEAFHRAPSDTLVYSIYAPSVPAFREQLGARAEGLLWATVTGTYSDPLARAFVAKYTSRFGVKPGRSHAGIAYDRVRLAASAWSQVANPRDRGAVAIELRHSAVRGVNGAYWFDNDSQTALSYTNRTMDPSLAQAHLVFQIQDGRQRILSPTPYADTVFRPQPWLTRTAGTRLAAS
ncbi:ABC transporter substrate-binding protein [Nakamurella leprariae]|uniref:ABC transporter substrate-binding protein n=1 Tax=Nakamurella leprariae TaxID=2803911 RepID=A0A938YDC5_9ACTN|nr:ABC transporter substrate-binding protein [Nakamurella leprariae]MBM9466109.1 ABC transporter substrate-binding protein [Nakamurella leprariae]